MKENKVIWYTCSCGRVKQDRYNDCLVCQRHKALAEQRDAVQDNRRYA